jgi:hypothetical protein
MRLSQRCRWKSSGSISDVLSILNPNSGAVLADASALHLNFKVQRV